MYSCSYRQSNYIMLVLLSCFFLHFMCVPFLFRSSFASSSTRLSHCPRTISMTLNLNQLSGGSAVDKGATVSLPSGCLSSNTSAFLCSLRAPQAPWNLLDRDTYLELRNLCHKRALQLCPGSSQKQARILISARTSGILWVFNDSVLVRFVRERNCLLNLNLCWKIVSAMFDWKIYILENM